MSSDDVYSGCGCENWQFLDFGGLSNDIIFTLLRLKRKKGNPEASHGIYLFILPHDMNAPNLSKEMSESFYSFHFESACSVVAQVMPHDVNTWTIIGALLIGKYCKALRQQRRVSGARKWMPIALCRSHCPRPLIRSFAVSLFDHGHVTNERVILA